MDFIDIDKLVSGAQLRSARRAVGLDQEDLALESGVSLSTIRALEKFGQRPCTKTSTIRAVLRALSQRGAGLTADGHVFVQLQKQTNAVA
jgi:predicted transcriptional regulator